MITPILMFSFILINARPKRFGLYPSSSATLRTRSSTSGRTFPLLFNTRSTVPLETPDSSAICRIVTLILIPVCHDQSTLYSSSSPPRILKAFFSSLCSSCDISDNTSLFTSSTVARIGFCNAFPFSVNTTSINLRSSLLT